MSIWKVFFFFLRKEYLEVERKKSNKNNNNNILFYYFILLNYKLIINFEGIIVISQKINKFQRYIKVIFWIWTEIRK